MLEAARQLAFLEGSHWCLPFRILRARIQGVFQLMVLAASDPHVWQICIEVNADWRRSEAGSGLEELPVQTGD